MGEVEKGEILSPPVSLLSAKVSAGWAGISKNRIKEEHDKRGTDKLISRAGRLWVSTARPSAAVTTARGCTNAGSPPGLLRDSAGTAPGPRLPHVPGPARAVPGAAAPPAGGSRAAPGKGRSRSFPQGTPGSIPTPARSRRAAEALQGSPGGCRWLFTQPQRGNSGEGSPVPVGCA